MKFLYALLSRLLMIVILAASVAGMLINFPFESKWFDPIRHFGNWLVQWILPRPHMIFWFWFGIFWVIIALGALASALRRRTDGIAVELDGGKVVILESAIRKFLRTALREVEGFSLRRVEIYRLRRTLHVDLYAQVRTRTELPELEKRVIAIVKDALNQQLGIQETAVVQLYVQDFVEGASTNSLLYQRDTEEEESTLDTINEGYSSPSSQRVNDIDTPLTFQWEREEPEAKPIAAEEANDDQKTNPTSQETEQTSRGGFWSRWRKKRQASEKSDQPSAEETSSSSAENSDSKNE
jgi:uncharacterized alkaline shock family protein YloU